MLRRQRYPQPRQSQRYASATEIAEVEKLQKEILEVIKKIHNPLRTFSAFFMFSFLYIWVSNNILHSKYIRNYIVGLAGSHEFDNLNEKLEFINTKYDSPKFKKLEYVVNLCRSHKLRDEKTCRVAESGMQELKNLVAPLEDPISFMDLWLVNSFFSYIMLVLPLYSVSFWLLNRIRDWWFLTNPLGFLSTCFAQYKDKESILTPYTEEEIKEITPVQNTLNKNKLTKLRDDAQLLNRKFQRVAIGIFLLTFGAHHILFDKEVGYHSQLLLAFVFTALEGTCREIVERCKNYNTNRTLQHRLDCLNQISTKIGANDWSGYPKDNPSMFVLNITQINGATIGQNFRALQLAFAKSNIKILTPSKNQIVLDLNVGIDEKQISSITDDFNYFLSEEKNAYEENNAYKEKKADEEKNRHFVNTTPPQDFTIGQNEEHHEVKRRPKLEKPAVVNELNIDIKNSEKKEDKPIIIDFGEYGHYDSSKKGEIVELRSPYWPARTHFGLFAAKERDFKDMSTYEQFKSVCQQGDVVPTEGHTGIVRSRESIRINREWCPIFYKVKVKKKNLRVYQTIPAIQIGDAHLHIFNRVIHKSHR